MIGTWKAIVDPSIPFQTLQKFKIAHDQSLFFSSIPSQNTNVALEKALVSNIALLQWLKNEMKALITKELLELY